MKILSPIFTMVISGTLLAGCADIAVKNPDKKTGHDHADLRGPAEIKLDEMTKEAGSVRSRQSKSKSNSAKTPSIGGKLDW